MKTLVLAKQKGGVGKSAVATLLAHHFRKLGHRVLAIDLGHQGNLSYPASVMRWLANQSKGADHGPFAG